MPDRVRTEATAYMHPLCANIIRVFLGGGLHDWAYPRYIFQLGWPYSYEIRCYLVVDFYETWIILQSERLATSVFLDVFGA